MNGIAHDLDAAEIGAAVLSQRLVMVAGNEDDPGTLANLTQQFLQDIVVRLQPDRSAPDPPEVYDVADKVDGVGIMLPQKVKKLVGLAGPRSEVHVRDKECSVTPALTAQIVPHGSTPRYLSIAEIGQTSIADV